MAFYGRYLSYPSMDFVFIMLLKKPTYYCNNRFLHTKHQGTGYATVWVIHRFQNKNRLISDLQVKYNYSCSLGDSYWFYGKQM